MLSALLLLPFIAQQSHTAVDQLLRLRDGRVLVCEIISHDFDGLVVTALRDGGTYGLDWNDLFPGESARLRADLGYRVETSVPQVSADQLLLVNGQVLLGRVVGNDGINLELRIHESRSLIPLHRLAAPVEKVMVPAPQVLTPEQFYQERVLEFDSADPLALYGFAVELQNVFALDRALEVLERAEEITQVEGDNALLARLSNLRRSTELTRANLAQAEALEEVRQLIHRKRFPFALEKLEAFGETFPDSPLKVDYLDLQEKFETSRVAAMEKHLSRNWFNTLSGLLKKRALDRGAGVDELMGWAESELPVLMRAKMLDQLHDFKQDLTLEDVESLWPERVEHGAKRHQANFGIGSWILGEDRARAGLDPDPEDVDDGKTPEQRDLEERTRRYLENLERARSKVAGDDDASPDDWWRNANANQRFQWLLAYYAEFSGDYELTHVSFSSCQTCAGGGVIRRLELGAEGGKSRKRKCPTCHGVGVWRSVTFR